MSPESHAVLTSFALVLQLKICAALDDYGLSNSKAEVVIGEAIHDTLAQFQADPGGRPEDGVPVVPFGG